jgi:ankyrin repeat protein
MWNAVAALTQMDDENDARCLLLLCSNDEDDEDDEDDETDLLLAVRNEKDAFLATSMKRI